MEESILDQAMMDAYKMKGITPDPTTQDREPPLIEDVYKSLIGMEEEKAKMLAARMEKYIKGSFAGIFNQKTTINLVNPFVVFGIKNLEDSLRPVAMNIILDYIWTVVKKSLKKRILVVDEAWYLMQYDDSAAFLRGIVKRGRKYYLGVTTITQDVDDFLKTDYGKEIVTNSAIQILLKQHAAAIDQIGEVFYLSQGEKQLLLTADKGQGIFFAGQNHVAIQVISSEEEHNLITSNPEEVLNKRKIATEKPVRPDLKEEKKNITSTPLPPKPEPVMEKMVESKKEANNEMDVETILQRKIENLEQKENELLQEKIPKGKFEGEIKINQSKPEPVRFVPPLKPEIVKPEEKQKPIFIAGEETKVPQPPQLIKKPTPVFEDKKDKNQSEGEKSGLNYDDLFDNGIV